MATTFSIGDRTYDRIMDALKAEKSRILRIHENGEHIGTVDMHNITLGVSALFATEEEQESIARNAVARYLGDKKQEAADAEYARKYGCA